MWRRYVLVQQNDLTDCGAAALATLALHYRIAIGLEQMRELTGTGRLGTNLLGLQRAAEALGFSAKAIKAPYEALPRLPLPAIAHVRDRDGAGHFVVIYKVIKDSVLIGDPARGVVKWSRADFCRDWTGNLLLAVPLMAASRRSRRGPVRPWRRFLELLRAHKIVVLQTTFCALLLTILGVSTSFFVQHLVDSVLVRQEKPLLNALGIGMVLIAVFRALFGVLRHYLLAYLGRKVDLVLLSDYSRHLLGLPLRFFESRRVGEILSRAMDTSKIREALSAMTTTTLVDGILIILLLGVLWLYDIPLALLATGLVPVLLGATALHHPATLRRSQAATEGWSELAAHMIEDISAVQTVKAFGAERLRSAAGEKRLVEFVQANFGLQMLGLSMTALGTLLTALMSIGLLWYGGHRVMAGALTTGQLMFCYSLILYMLEPLNRLAAVNLKLQEALVAVDRLYQVMDLELEQKDGHRKAAFRELQQAIELRNVSFRFGARPKVLDRVSLRIPVGKKVAVIGESGSGKSTLLNLLMGFHAPSEGRILIDGVDLRDLDLESLRSRFGLVAQDPFIFSGSIRDNIALGRPDASLDEVIEAARAAGLDEFIAGLPERYDTLIGERGSNLSGGQRQRLAIARALLRKPDILVFDEATSHLDTATERAIQHSLSHGLADKTVILVAHRLSTIRHADLIYVLHQGCIVEQGTHRQLLARQGRYAALCRAQDDDRDATWEAQPPAVSKNGQGTLEVSHA